MKIAFLGTGDFGIPAVEALRDAGHTIKVGISQPDRAAGRGRQVRPTPIHVCCARLSISHVQTEDVNTPEHVAMLAEADIAVVAAFGQKLGPSVLSAPRLGCINIHASLLPRYRGAAPFQWAILNGDATTGVTVFQINERWDAGAIWGARETPIGESETADELHDRLARIGAELLIEILPGIDDGTRTAMMQDASLSTRARKLMRADSAVDFSQPAQRVARWINGLWSWPGATCTFVSAGGKPERVQLARARVIPGATAGGSAAGSFRSDGLVETGGGAIEILEIKPAGGKLMTFDSFARGRDIRPPAQLAASQDPADG